LAEERLRSEARGRAIVVVGIGDVVRVELDLVVVEVEVRSVVEDIIAGIGEFAFIHLYSPDIEGYFPLKTISSQSCILFDGISIKKKTRHR